jgi:hypothetical protein
MVAINGLRLFAEFTDEQGQSLGEPQYLSEFSVDSDYREDELHLLNGDVYRLGNGMTSGKIRMKCCSLGHNSFINNLAISQMTTRPERLTIHIKQNVHHEVRSYNTYYDCFMTSVSHELMGFNTEVTLTEMHWRFSRTRVTLNLPQELLPEVIDRNEMRARIFTMPTRAVEWEDHGDELRLRNPRPVKSITSGDWLKLGF